MSVGSETSRMQSLLWRLVLCCLSFENCFSMYCIHAECHFCSWWTFLNSQNSVHCEGTQRSFPWPKCLSGENTILGFPQAICMIPEGTDYKDFKGILGLGEEMQSSPLPLVLCVHQPRDLWAGLTGNSRCKQKGLISKYFRKFLLGPK